MPIRMVEDENNEEPRDNYPGDGGGGGSSSGGGLIRMLLPLLLRYPKLLILLVVIGVVIYFLGGGGLFSNKAVLSQLGLGCSMSQAVYDKAEVYEPLADNSKNPLPDRISFEQFAPQRLNQGVQGSCVAWASAYAARSIQAARSTGKPANEVAFSPSFLYNQVALQGCQGSYVLEAMKVMSNAGSLPYKNFPYTDRDCSEQPSKEMLEYAKQFKIKGYNRLTKGGEDYKVDLLAIKQHLAGGAPVVIGMMVGGSFMQGMMGQEVWIPERSDYSMSGFGGHALCVIGYDDFKAGGAFQIMNSWGEEWGKNGIGWVRYKDFEHFTKEAYGLYPTPAAGQQINDQDFTISFGLIDNKSGQAIPLIKRDNISCNTVNPIQKETKFKIEVTNNMECYTYIFGEETDGTTYTLFPYTAKHSPYCGVTGTRLFPKDYSLQADEIGSKDIMAVLVSRVPIDYKTLAEKMAADPEKGLLKRLQKALGIQIAEASIGTADKNIRFKGNLPENKVLTMLIEIDKQ